MEHFQAIVLIKLSMVDQKFNSNRRKGMEAQI